MLDFYTTASDESGIGIVNISIADIRISTLGMETFVLECGVYNYEIIIYDNDDDHIYDSAFTILVGVIEIPPIYDIIEIGKKATE